MDTARCPAGLRVGVGPIRGDVAIDEQTDEAALPVHEQLEPDLLLAEHLRDIAEGADRRDPGARRTFGELDIAGAREGEYITIVGIGRLHVIALEDEAELRAGTPRQVESIARLHRYAVNLTRDGARAQ